MIGPGMQQQLHDQLRDVGRAAARREGYEAGLRDGAAELKTAVEAALADVDDLDGLEGVFAALAAAPDLAAVRAEAKAEALREAAVDADRSVIVGTETTRPDRVADWLRDRADRIASGEGER